MSEHHFNSVKSVGIFITDYELTITSQGEKVWAQFVHFLINAESHSHTAI